MHAKRWITSIIGVPILVALIFMGPPLLFAAFIAAVALVAMWEYFYIVFGGETRRIYTPIPVWGALAGALIIIAAFEKRYDFMILMLLINTMGAAVLSIAGFRKDAQVLDVVAKEIQAVVYIPLALSTLVLLRAAPAGHVWIFFLLFIIFSGDVGAFYVGTYFGRHKLSPAISPGKTIEGAAGGLVTNLVVGLAFKAIFLPHLPALETAVFILLTGMAGQIGDLYESEMKRVAGIKDSGTILPGHGGILDRIDALLFGAPLAYLFYVYCLQSSLLR